MLKRNNIVLSVFSAIAALAALLIFMLLPASELANSIEHSAKDALWVLVLSPLLSLLGSASFLAVFLKEKKTWIKLLCEPIVIAAIGFTAVFGLFNFATYLSYTINQFSLGFVAPFAGTAYEQLAVAATVITVLNFVFSAIVVIAAMRSKKLN